MNEKELFSEYEELTVEQKLSYNHEVQRIMDQEPFIHQELCNFLLTKKENFHASQFQLIWEIFEYKHNHKSHPTT